MDVWGQPDFMDAEKAAFAFAVAAAQVSDAVTPEIASRSSACWDEGEVVEFADVAAFFGFLDRRNDMMSTSL